MKLVAGGLCLSVVTSLGDRPFSVIWCCVFLFSLSSVCRCLVYCKSQGHGGIMFFFFLFSALIKKIAVGWGCILNPLSLDFLARRRSISVCVAVFAVLATGSGHLAILQYARENDCPWDTSTCSYAAESGGLTTLQLAKANGCPWDASSCSSAAVGGHHLHIYPGLANE